MTYVVAYVEVVKFVLHDASQQGFAQGCIFLYTCLLVCMVGIIYYGLCARHLVCYGRRLVCMVGI